MSDKEKLSLAIETSCDDTSIAIVNQEGFVKVQVSADQNQEHEAFGGVVPEVASRNHTKNILPLVHQALEQENLKPKDLACISVTNRPGLVGSLLVGLVTAKTLSQSWGLPFLGVNHLEGHILAPWLKDKTHTSPDLKDSLPAVVLTVSGGHTHLYHFSKVGTYEVLGRTIDDAAGEALDKFAKELGLGFPGGANLDRWARQGDPSKYEFSQGLLRKGLNFSFSGTKASAMRLLESMEQKEIETNIADLSASFEKSVVDVLFVKLKRALETYPDVVTIALSGGVSANTYLRQCAKDLSKTYQKQILVPPLKYCTDNAAMIGFAGLQRFLAGETSELNLAPLPRSLPSDFIYPQEDS